MLQKIRLFDTRGYERKVPGIRLILNHVALVTERPNLYTINRRFLIELVGMIEIIEK